jgi:hypothetical protein
MNKYLQTIVLPLLQVLQSHIRQGFEITQKVIKVGIVLDQIRTVDRIRIITSFGVI